MFAEHAPLVYQQRQRNIWRHIRVKEKKNKIYGSNKKQRRQLWSDGVCQTKVGLFRQLTWVSHWLKWRVMVGLDWQAQWPLRLMKGAIGRQMRVWWEGTRHMEWWTKRSKFGAQHERESVLCTLWSEKWKVLWSGASWQEGFSTVKSTWCLVDVRGTGNPAWWNTNVANLIWFICHSWVS